MKPNTGSTNQSWQNFVNTTKWGRGSSQEKRTT